VLQKQWNNAFLVGYLTYRQDYSLWDDVFTVFDGDLKAMVTWLGTLEGDPDPFLKVKAWLEEVGGSRERN